VTAVLFLLATDFVLTFEIVSGKRAASHEAHSIRSPCDSLTERLFTFCRQRPSGRLHKFTARHLRTLVIVLLTKNKINCRRVCSVCRIKLQLFAFITLNYYVITVSYFVYFLRIRTQQLPKTYIYNLRQLLGLFIFDRRTASIHFRSKTQ